MINPINRAEAHSAGGPNRPKGASPQELKESKEANMRMQIAVVGSPSNTLINGSTQAPNDLGALGGMLPGYLISANRGANLRRM